MLDDADVAIEAIPRPALVLAGKVFQRYRAAGGLRTGALPRDARRFRTYVPTIELITS